MQRYFTTTHCFLQKQYADQDFILESLADKQFTRKELATFFVTSAEVVFFFDFGFAHAIQGTEPDGFIKIPRAEFRKYLKVNPYKV